MGGRAARSWAGAVLAALAAAAAPAADPPPVPSPQAVIALQPPVPPAPPPAPGVPANPFLPQPPAETDAVLPDGTRVTLPAATKQLIRFAPRYGVPPNYKVEPIDRENNINRVVYVGGVIINVTYQTGPDLAPQQQEIEFATDNAVVWIKRPKGEAQPANPAAETLADERTEVEVYLNGNVVIRTVTTTQSAGGTRTIDQVLRAREVYYDVNRSRAIALGADLEMRVAGFQESVRVRGTEVWELSRNEYRIFESDVSASRRPASPGVRITSDESTLTVRQAVRRNVFGIPYRDVRTGQVEVGQERTLYSDWMTVRVYDVPVFFWPRMKTDANDPLGPLSGIGFGKDRIFGTQFYTTWDVYQLVGLRPQPGHQWRLHLDYMDLRGPAVGTDYSYTGSDLFGLAGTNPATGQAAHPEWLQPYTGLFRGYFIRDTGQDQIGRDLGPNYVHPVDRGRLLWRHNQDVYENGTTYLRVLAQATYQSDRTFLEQFYNQEWNYQPNQETFLYAVGAMGNAGGSVLFEDRFARKWITETAWLPRAQGYRIGDSLLWDRVISSTWADAGYAILKPAEVFPLPVLPTDVRDNTGRFHAQERLHVPFDLGPLRLDPYAVGDAAYYTADVTGEGRGRLYGGGGLKASATLSRLYPEASSELFNVNGLNHKVTYGANYYAARSSSPYTLFPQLNRLSDDQTDFDYRLARPVEQQFLNNAAGFALSTSPLFDPQRYAIRRLVLDNPDTLDSVQVLQLDVRQRFQTKRGFPGAQHIVDWFTLDLSGSLFPDDSRDNFGKRWAFLEYYALWHVGDRTSLASSGWFDPFDVGVRYYDAAINFNRPDGTNFSLQYRHTDPLQSRQVTVVGTYPITRKYSISMANTYDFGLNKALSQQVNVVRVGSDLTVMFGITYNAIVNNLGVQFALVPNLASLALSRPGVSPLYNPFLGRR